MSAAGILIRQLRAAKNYSQAGLCHGICSTSYLSKIEQGQAEASPEILSMLFRVLGVDYCRDETLIAQARRCLDTCYEAWEQYEEPQDAAQWLDAHLNQLLYGDLYLDIRTYQLFRAEHHSAAAALVRELEPFAAQMSPQQHFRYLLTSVRWTPDPKSKLELLHQAARYENTADIQLQIAWIQYRAGQYSACIETSELAYQLAANVGNLYVLIWSSFLLGSCHTNRDLRFAERYYRRAIRLSQKSDPALADMAYYNLGASCLEWGKPEQALHWLEQCHPLDGYSDHNLLLEQKKALLYIHFGRKQDAALALERANRHLETMNDADDQFQSLFCDMLEFARLLLDGQEYSDAFEETALRLYTQAGTRMGFGFRRFYGLYLVRWYRSQRRYKDALRITEEIQEEVS